MPNVTFTNVSGEENFSYELIDSDVLVVVPLNQQMITFKQLEMNEAGELQLDGNLILTE